jgi:(1->4)-alpha-D-glucan 1-alpha-D-glucosylmutase
MNLELSTLAPDAVPVQQFICARRLPTATYRLQFNRTFTFRDVTAIVPYLYNLGISDSYASPYLKAAPGSLHGYDVSDHTVLNPEIGNMDEYNAMVAELQRHSMGQLLDIVPNHMGIAGGQNLWWMNVLENGPSSPYAAFFDIDWRPLKTDLANKVLLPILGDQYGRVLENQDLRLEYDNGAIVLTVYGHTRLPVAPKPMAMVLTHRLEILEHQLGLEHPAYIELQSIVTALSHLPSRTETDPEKVRERQREKEVIKRRLATLIAECNEVQDFVATNIRHFNGVKGDPRSFDLLDALLAEQGYRLAYWRVAAEEINYRRFFDVNELAALRTEDPAVFVAIHQFSLQLFAEGKVTGFRIDHIDGLSNPSEYLRRLQHACAALRAGQNASQFSTEFLDSSATNGNGSSSERPPGVTDRPCYVVVEKILASEERLPETWLVDGTSGYDFLPLLNGIFIDPQGERPCTETYNRFTKTAVKFADVVYDSKKLIMQVALSSELNVLAHQLDRLTENDRHSRDFTLNLLRHALREIIACFPVYRTYITHAGVSTTDRAVIEQAVARAKRRNPATDASVFDFVRDALLLSIPKVSGDEVRLSYLTFVMKFQQYTGPVMAKGLEDTAFYRYHRLVSLNEVGGTPDRFGTSLLQFHQRNQERLRHWPHSLLATSTHDTKRSEDVRARINVLSAIPLAWRTAVNRWSKRNKKKKTMVDGQLAPDLPEEYLFYQTLLGTWPLTELNDDTRQVLSQRLQAYLHKATKEAKVHTSWLNPHQAYDEAVQRFVHAVLEDSVFLREFTPFAETVAVYGMYNSLAQTLLKLTVPGVPDIYQGNEIWDFSVVDPDNRRPVDYQHRQRLLTELQTQVQRSDPHLSSLAQGLLETWRGGRIKLYVTYRTLNYRREHADLFRAGTYVPLEVIGEAQLHICAFARRGEQDRVLVVVPRLLARLLANVETPPLGDAVWKNTHLRLPPQESGQQYRNLFTGELLQPTVQGGQPILALAEVFAHFPVALLVAE